jgi:toxin ParE1/3/4
VGSYEYSRPAESDVDEIVTFTIRTWGHRQAARYLGGLETLCQGLADGHGLAARPCAAVAPGLFRVGYERHVVFFRRTSYGIRVVRVLHERMQPDSHRFEDVTDE